MSGKRLGKRLRTGPLPEKRFDMEREPVEQKMYLMPIVWGFSYIRKWLHRGKLNKVRMEGVKPPYILLCNHNSFYDFYIMSAALAPQRGFFPAAVDDYIGREEILRKLGTIPKRKYTADISLLRQCRKVLKSGSIFGIYVEDSNPFRYCAEYYDSETEFIYLRARYYSPDSQRFISEDPIKYG